MAKLQPILRDLLMAGTVQFMAILFAASILDQGGFLLATRRLSAAYWCGVILILLRRHASPTAGDHQYFRWGLIPVPAIGVPVPLSIWALRGTI